MRIDGVAILVAGVASTLLSAASLRAQDPLTTIGPATQVRSIEFHFLGSRTLPEGELRRQIALTERGSLVWLRRILGWLPLIQSVGQYPFDPLVLQRDVVRLRRYYQRNGFLQAEIDYEVTYDAESDLVDVTFLNREGPPLLLASVTFQGADSDPPLLAPELEESWSTFVRQQREAGGRYTEQRRLALADSTTRWLRNRGYPFGLAQTTDLIDSASNRAAVTVQVQPGARARLRAIAVSGNDVVPAKHLIRQIPLDVGDWYDASRLERGRQQLMQFDLVRLALVDVPRESLRDSTVAVNLRVTENPPRLVRSEAGVASAGGITGQVDWTHRGFLGGLRTLTIGGAAQTGLVSLESPAREEYRLSVSMFQPYIGHRRLSLALGPFAEYRNDLRDRSWRAGVRTALVYASGPIRSIALGYRFSRRRVLDYGFGTELDPMEYLPLLGLADPDAVGTLGNTYKRSALSLEASWGHLDRFANPRQGYVLRPRVEITTPFLSTNEYLLLEMGATAFLPLNDRIGFTLRAGAGRILPFGKSLQFPEDESPFVSLLRLQDATFTAGGSRDVRGWGTQLLGPKLPKVELVSRDGITVPVAEQYTPVGGLARVLTSAEVHLPVPGMSERWQSLVFLDGGRVWTPDARFRLDAGELAQDRFYFGTGAGIGYETVVGAVQVALGYKLNPSPLDLRDPNDVVNALVDGRPLSEVPTNGRRRWHLHFSIGATF